MFSSILGFNAQAGHIIKNINKQSILGVKNYIWRNYDKNVGLCEFLKDNEVLGTEKCVVVL